MKGVIDSIRRNLQQLMDEHEWDQSELARRATVDQGTVSKILGKDTRNPRVDTLVDLAHALGVTVSDLTGERENPPKPPLLGPIAYFQRYYGVNDIAARHMKAVVETLIDWGRVIQQDRHEPDPMRRVAEERDPYGTTEK